MATLNRMASKVCHLKPAYFLGIDNRVSGNVHFIDENRIFYPIGRVFIIHNLLTDVQHYLKMPESPKTVCIVAMSPNRKFVAVVEKGDKPTISVFNVETGLRIIILGNPLPNCSANTFDFLSFTCDNEHIVAITGPPDWMMIYYKINGHVESYAKAMGESPPLSALNVTQVACNPSDPTILCITGLGLFRFVSWTDNTWLQYGFNSAGKLQITDVCWLTDEIVVAGTMCGRLVVVEYGDVKGVYRANSVAEIHIEKEAELRIDIDSKSIPKGYKYGVCQISGLTSFSKGFAFSCTRTTVTVFERSSILTWSRKNVFYTIEPSRIVYNHEKVDQIHFVAVSPSNLRLACTTGRKEIYYTDIQEKQEFVEGEFHLFNKVLNGFHVGRVPSIATCRWKPLMMSVGKDEGCCRIWNYKTKTLLYSQHYPDDKIYGCALHPSGWYCLIGFKHQLKMFIVLVDELQPLRLFRIKACNSVNFSCEGHMFAAGNNQKSTIEIYCTVSFENLWTLKCYNRPITAVHFGSKDNFVYTTDPDGSINVWDLQTGEDTNTKIYLDTAHYDVTTTRSGAVYFIGADGNLKEIENEQLHRYKINQSALYSIALGESEECLFVGGEKCSIVSIEFPLLETAIHKEYKMHSWPIKKLLVTNNDTTLISLDENGIVGFWSIKFPSEKRFPKFDHTSQLTDVIVNIKKLAEEDETMKKQQLSVNRKLYQHNYIIQHLEEVKQRALDNLTEDYLSQIVNLKKQMSASDKLHATQTSKHQQQLEELTKFYVGELEKQSKESESDLMNRYLKSDKMKGQMMVFVGDVRKFFKTSKSAVNQIFDFYDSFVNQKVSDIKLETAELQHKKKSLLQKFSRETYNFEKFLNDCMDQYKEYHDRRLTKLGKRKEYLKDEIIYLIKKSSLLEDKIKNFYSSGVRAFKNLDDLRIDSRILKSKNRALQVMLDAVEVQTKKKDELIINVRKLLKSDVHEQMEKTERLEILKLVLKPAIESELKECQEVEERLHYELLNKKSKIVSVSLCIVAVEKKINNAMKKSNQIAYEGQIKKFIEGVKTDLNNTNLISDNRVELKKALMALYKKYIDPNATWSSIEETCDVAPSQVSYPDVLGDVGTSGLEDVVEFHQIESLLKKGEQSLKAEIQCMKKMLPNRPTLVVGHKKRVFTPSRLANVVREINNYRYRVAEALEQLGAQGRTDDCYCASHSITLQ